MNDDFPCYLAAKKTVDDRALNKDVWQQLRQAIPDQPDIHTFLQTVKAFDCV